MKIKDYKKQKGLKKLKDPKVTLMTDDGHFEIFLTPEAA